MLVDGQGGSGDLWERHGGEKIYRTNSNGGLACGVKSFDVVYEFLPFDNITREPQTVMGS